ncbi:response regulator [bacterium]|nr:response regulator [bacterium]
MSEAELPNIEQLTVDIVDDDNSGRISLTRLCEAVGYRVRSAETAEAYLQMAPPETPCCVIVDLLLPGMDGLDLLDRLRHTRQWIPTIVLSAHADVAVAVRSMQLGALSVLEKPTAQSTLLAAIRSAIDVSRELEAARQLADTVDSLTDRERLVLDLLMDGELYKAIAQQLDLGVRTVERVRERILARTGYETLPPLIRDIGMLRGLKRRQSQHELPTGLELRSTGRRLRGHAHLLADSEEL